MMADAEKLLKLADWIDLKDPADANPEVQRDVRRIAAHLTEMTAERDAINGIMADDTKERHKMVRELVTIQGKLFVAEAQLAEVTVERDKLNHDFPVRAEDKRPGTIEGWKVAHDRVMNKWMGLANDHDALLAKLCDREAMAKWYWQKWWHMNRTDCPAGFEYQGESNKAHFYNLVDAFLLYLGI